MRPMSSSGRKRVTNRWHKAYGNLRGADVLRERFRVGLELDIGLHSDLEAVFSVLGDCAVPYRRENNNRGRDVVEPDRAGKAHGVKALKSRN
jgi:hypothetical protein